MWIKMNAIHGIFQNSGKCFTSHPLIVAFPLRVKIYKLSEICDVGTLNLCLVMPDTMQKELAQSDHPAP